MEVVKIKEALYVMPINPSESSCDITVCIWQLPFQLGWVDQENTAIRSPTEEYMSVLYEYDTSYQIYAGNLIIER